MISQINQFLDEQKLSCAILGTNGSGKSLLAEKLFQTAELPCALVSLEQQLAVLDEERRNDDSDFLDYPDPGRSVADFIAEAGAISEELRERFEQFQMSGILERGLKFLSTGEFRKAQIFRALAQKPQRLILDEPFDGLDAASQEELKGFMNEIAADGVQLVLLLNRIDEVSEAVEQIFLIDEFGLVDTVSRGDDLERFFHMVELPAVLPEPPEREALNLNPEIPLIDFKQVGVAYGDKQIFQGLDWRVEPGEHWQVSGPNGCGKTTLLEMVTGDHPQLYSNDVNVFGIRRGSGESVWDIKKYIGHVSSSVQVNYRVSASVQDVVISGLHDSIGLYRKPTLHEIKCAKEWITLLHLGHKIARPLRTLSYGEQRLVLIARAMIKRPTLLVLDEPCQGLDEVNRRTILNLINHIGERSGTTLLYVSHHATDQVPCIKQKLTMGN